MSFATDYATAYRLLRTGAPATETFYSIFPELVQGAGPKIGEITTRPTRSQWRALKERVGRFGRVQAAIYAFKMVKEMRRQKVLMNVLFDIKEEQPTQVVNKTPINLFPVTVNRTVVQMRDPDKGPNA